MIPSCFTWARNFNVMRPENLLLELRLVKVLKALIFAMKALMEELGEAYWQNIRFSLRAVQWKQKPRCISSLTRACTPAIWRDMTEAPSYISIINLLFKESLYLLRTFLTITVIAGSVLSVLTSAKFNSIQLFIVAPRLLSPCA